jgi:hypothetical protein
MAKIFKWALLSLCLAASAMQAAELLDEAAFTQLIADRIVALGVKIKPQVPGSFSLELEGADKKTSILNLDNAFARYKSAPDSLEDVAADFGAVAKKMTSPLVAAEAGLETLLPAVRDLEYIRVLQVNTQKFEGEHKGDQLAVLPLFGELGIVLAFDMESSTEFATWRRIEGLGIKRDEALALALRNFERIEVDPDINVFKGFVGLDAGGSYQASLLLTDAYWERQKFPFKGDLVAFPVTRDVMFLTGSEETEGLKAARDMAVKWIEENAYPMSSQPIVRRSGKWSVFEE